MKNKIHLVEGSMSSYKMTKEIQAALDENNNEGWKLVSVAYPAARVAALYFEKD
jgi:hypothetical protein